MNDEGKVRHVDKVGHRGLLNKTNLFVWLRKIDKGRGPTLVEEPTLCIFERTYTRHCGRARTRALCRTHALFLYFHWRIVSQKSTFNCKRLVFLRTRLHKGTRKRPRTGHVRIGAGVKGHSFSQEVAAESHNEWSRDCGFRPTTRQRVAHKMYKKAQWIRGSSVLFIFSSFSSSAPLSVSYWNSYYYIASMLL